MAKLEAAQAKLRQVKADANQRALVQPYRAKPGLLRKQWGGLTVDQKRSILRAIIDRVDIGIAKPGHVFDMSRINMVWKA
jgi:hypothetical protein